MFPASAGIRWHNAGNDPLEKLLVSILDAADALSVGRTTVYELMRTDQLETRKMGRRRLITAESLRRLVDKQD